MRKLYHPRRGRAHDSRHFVTWPRNAEAVQFTDSSGRPVHHRHRSFAICSEPHSSRRPRSYNASYRRSISLTARAAVDKRHGDDSRSCAAARSAKLCLLGLNVSSTLVLGRFHCSPLRNGQSPYIGQTAPLRPLGPLSTESPTAARRARENRFSNVCKSFIHGHTEQIRHRS